MTRMYFSKPLCWFFGYVGSSKKYINISGQPRFRRSFSNQSAARFFASTLGPPSDGNSPKPCTQLTAGTSGLSRPALTAAGIKVDV